MPNSVVAGLAVEKDSRGRILVEPTMRCQGRPQVWALGDCASIPGPDGRPYPSLAQHAMREASVLAKNIHNVLNKRPPKPFIYETVGMMGSLGHNAGFGQFLKMRIHGFPAWFARRTYYLLQMPGWSRRLRMMIDWTLGLVFPPDTVKVALDTEMPSLLRKVEPRHTVGEQMEDDGPPKVLSAGGRTPTSVLFDKEARRFPGLDGMRNVVHAVVVAN
jgi:hypothetical protein